VLRVDALLGAALDQPLAAHPWQQQQQPLLLCPAADLRTLAALIPERARMVLEGAGAPADAAPETASVPTASVAAGDVLRVLPGERMPVRAPVVQTLCCCGRAVLVLVNAPFAVIGLDSGVPPHDSAF
jgi:hypothetical protein